MDEFASYAAGFFDGEGWVVISLERGSETRSDCHHIGVYATQRARYRDVLDRFQVAFGGTVSIIEYKIKGRQNWADKASWHIHTRPQIEHFCLAVHPYCIVKAQQIAIALEFVTGYQASPIVRDGRGRVRAGALSRPEVERRERLRLALKEVNAKEPWRNAPQAVDPRAAHCLDGTVPERPPTDPAKLSRGEHRPLARLTDDAVRAIRTDYAAGGITMGTLALRYGVTPSAIRQVIRRLSWQHVE